MILACSLAALAGCKQEEPPKAVPIPVETAVVQTIPAGSGTKYSANIAPYAQVDLAFQSNGYIDSIYQVPNPSGGRRNVDQGDWIPKETVLAVVKQQNYLDRLQQAKAQLARAQAEHEKARLSFERVSALYATQSATAPDYDSAKAQLDSTAASVSGGEAQVSEATVALDNCFLKAPFSGWLVARNVELGSLVGPATKGFTLADSSSVKAVFGVPDTYMNRVRLGQHFVVSTDALPRPFDGRVSAISSSADQKSRVFSVEVTIPNPRNVLKPGMIASLALEGQRLPPAALVVPLAAVIRNPGHVDSFAVMIAEGNDDLKSVRLRPIELGDTYGNMIVARSGVDIGDRVITTGASLVKDGDKVRVSP
ncbi:efflux RND transporter periplasmic adaptor subunit [Alloacidobacterium dinghuense]|uniref:Efflux RND transporter periplasmic adaptor subunit n=2 Tax=Alloacidobacterium dinghuense TaxID=2763107 RepID=A0A7G8BRI5_9BACT|nr:efflux RND transporter periplasmic adaptor subunit [Alloacidobacterium dinghuense]